MRRAKSEERTAISEQPLYFSPVTTYASDSVRT